MVVDGSDLVDLDAQDLLDVLSSWEGQRPPVPPGMRVACAPDRRKHEAQLKNLSRYREEVEQHPETVAEEVEIKRLEHEQWLDYREISEGFSGQVACISLICISILWIASMSKKSCKTNAIQIKVTDMEDMTTV